MLAAHEQRHEEPAAFSSTFKQQAKKLFSVDSLLDSQLVVWPTYTLYQANTASRSYQIK